MSQPEQKPDQTPDLAAELRELGQQIEAALRSALESERARQLQQELLNGLRAVNEQVQTAAKMIAENPRVQELAERGQQALHQLQQSQAAHDLQQTWPGELLSLMNNLPNSSSGCSHRHPLPAKPLDSTRTSLNMRWQRRVFALSPHTQRCTGREQLCADGIPWLSVRPDWRPVFP